MSGSPKEIYEARIEEALRSQESLAGAASRPQASNECQTQKKRKGIRMRITYGLVALLAASLLLVAPTAALAHVTVSPEGVAPEDYATLTVKVPNEKEIPTTEVRVEIPEGFTFGGVQPVPGWEHRFEEDGGVVTAVTWSGGEIGPREFQQFPVSAQAPEEPGEYAFKAFQTYEDGSVVEWVGPPDSEEPASVVEVAQEVPQGSSAHETGAEAGSAPQAQTTTGASVSGGLPETGGIDPATDYGGGVAAGALAILLLVAASLAARRRAS